MLRFSWQAKAGLWCFVVFRPIHTEGFDAYVGWSTDGRCPYALPQEPRAIEDFVGPRAMTLSMVLVPREGMAHWNFWDVPDHPVDDPVAFATAFGEHFGKELTFEEAVAEVRGAVERGVREVAEFGLPYLLRRVAFGGES